ncbi:MAG: hypothetical protein K2W95_06100 [Candidatus Obscuribacterales bacterium]|nr:hypothetical protein [Candidatus Obscuribacterales bacterium]
MRYLTASRIALGLLLLSNWQGSFARNQWDMNHPGQPLPSAAMPVSSGIPGRNTLTQEFWAGNHPSLSNRIQSGVILTTVLEHEISSATSKVGDTFALRIDDGYARNGLQIIPPGSRIVGAVTGVVPAKSLRSGHAGQLQVSLQTLVMPDGVTHVPFHGFIDSNPNHAFKSPPQRRTLGNDVRDYGQQVAGMTGSFTSGLGTVQRARHQGLDFELDTGELVPVRLNQTLIVPESVVKPQVASTIPVQPSDPAPNPVQGLPSGAPGDSTALPSIPGLTPDVFQTPLGQGPPPNIDSMPDPF